jgi:DNA-directed RNA polymerase sigma subunit (sigma70/sigma32)
MKTYQSMFDDLTSPREKKILNMRYNLDGKGNHTLRETGKEFGVSAERIRQIENNAFDKFIENLNRWNILDLYFYYLRNNK